MLVQKGPNSHNRVFIFSHSNRGALGLFVISLADMELLAKGSAVPHVDEMDRHGSQLGIACWKLGACGLGCVLHTDIFKGIESGDWGRLTFYCPYLMYNMTYFMMACNG